MSVNDEVNVPAGGSLGGHSPPTSTSTQTPTSFNSMDDVVRSGYLRKLKGKKKFFVLRKETGMDKPARLEYYDKEKKFRTGQPPKKSIVLKACFNISRTDSKCKYSIALHTHNDCVRIAMSNEEEMNDWLRVMNSLAGEEDQVDNIPQSHGGKPHFEHIWLVTALNKGVGSKENIIGPYRLCLTSKEVTLLKVGEHDGRNGVVKFPLSIIRNVSHDATFGCFFHIELGRMSPTGPGLLSLKTEDNNIAQNMHLLILKAMQNYSKEDLIPPRDRPQRPRTNTWTYEQGPRTVPFQNSAPCSSNGMVRINSSDGSMAARGRTDSVSSSFSTKFGMSPPVPIQPPSFAFNSPLCSTGTDSASSSYSVDYDNNNHQNPQRNGFPEGYSKSHEEDVSYVQWNPADEQQTSLNSLNSLTLPLNQDNNEYVETSLGSNKDSSSTAQTPSSYMEMQSPMSPYDNYMPMSPGMAVNTSSTIKAGKSSVSHSRNSSLVEENDGYVPMNPSQNMRCESGGCSTAGSTTGLDDQYLDMDFGRKLNISNEDMRRMSPASSESLQSGTPSSDFPLEKVQSYLTDDFDDTSVRPARAYSVGSRSDTCSMSKSRAGKNRLEAVQETFRIRAMSVGSKAKRPFVNPNSTLFASPSQMLANGKSPAPLSSSWSGSTGRWPQNKLPSHAPNHSQPGQLQPIASIGSTSTFASESNDSDLMELDFSRNKCKGRKRSLPGPNNSAASSSGSAASSVTKVSPAPKALLASGRESPKTEDSTPVCNGLASSNVPKYPSSAPISIQKAKTSEISYGSPSTSSILTKMNGLEFKYKNRDEEDDGAYLDMDFSNKSLERKKTTHHELMSNLKNTFLNKPDKPVIVRPNESPTASKVSRFSSLTTPIATTTNALDFKGESLVKSLSNSSNLSSGSTLSSSSCNSIKTDVEPPRTICNSLSHSSMSEHCIVSGLSRIEEFPEKQDSKSQLQSPPPSPLHPPPGKVEEQRVTYAAIDHERLPPTWKSYSSSTKPTSGPSCGSSSAKASVTYAQIDFVKSAETITPN